MTAQENKANTFAEKLKSVGIALVGAGMAGKGATYFSPQLSYDVPRILVPVYESLGPKGLAVSMIILAVMLLIWSFFRWRKALGQALHWVLIAGIATIAIVGIVNFMGHKSESAIDPENMPAANAPAQNPVSAGAPIAFPGGFPADSKEEYEKLKTNLQAALDSKHSGNCWSAYNKLNIFLARLKPEPGDAKQSNFLMQQRQQMDVCNQQIKALTP